MMPPRAIRGSFLVFAIAFGTAMMAASDLHAGFIPQASFDPANNASPQLGYVDAQGNIYGSIRSYIPGSYEMYNVSFFEVAAGSGVVTRLGAISQYKESVYPGMVVDSNGNLFATSRVGSGSFGDEQLLEVSKDSGVVHVLTDYNNGIFNGLGITKLAIDKLGNVFGTSNLGGSNSSNGTLFEWKTGASQISTLGNFSGMLGSYPTPDLVVAPQGDLFGVTTSGGTLGAGTIFHWSQSTGTLSTLLNIDPKYGALTNLVGDANGNLYGLSQHGGTNGEGVLFTVKSGSTTITPLLDLNAPGQGITRILNVDAAGNIYGVGRNNALVELKIHETTLSTLAAGGSFPTSALIARTSSKGSTDVYGVSPSGGDHGSGFVFKVGTGGCPSAAAVPEIDPSTATAGLTLLMGGLLVLFDRKPRR